MLAVAYTNVDGIDGYDLAADVLIAKVVDTNGDGSPSVGDTVVTDRYPADMSANSFGTFTMNTHVVDSVTIFETQVFVSSGKHQFNWRDSVSFDYFYEIIAQSSGGTQIFDYIGGEDTADRLAAESPSPSAPDTAVPYTTLNRRTDDPFIDVDLFI